MESALPGDTILFPAGVWWIVRGVLYLTKRRFATGLVSLICFQSWPLEIVACGRSVTAR